MENAEPIYDFGCRRARSVIQDSCERLSDAPEKFHLLFSGEWVMHGGSKMFGSDSLFFLHCRGATNHMNSS
ncbi:MAG: hypothetical protein ACRDGA_09215, partial [Bacteroidota bacterium]